MNCSNTCKRTIRSLGFLFILVTVGVFLFKQYAGNSSPLNKSADAADESQQTVVYYFHGSARCMTCRAIETYTREALQEKYNPQLAKGELVFTLVNVSLPENAHFIKDYALTTSAVVVSELDHGKEVRWKRLDKVWNFVSVRYQFVEYIQSETAGYLKG